MENQVLEYLAFRLGNEEYGVDIQKVQELRGYEKPTAIASAPAYVKGVVNLRGVIVPILDLRLRMAIGEATYDQFTVVIILNVNARVVGLVVDSVSDVINLEAEQIKPPPALDQASHITGIGTMEDRMVLLTDIERMLGDSDVHLMEKLAA